MCIDKANVKLDIEQQWLGIVRYMWFLHGTLLLGIINCFSRPPNLYVSPSNLIAVSLEFIFCFQLLLSNLYGSYLCRSQWKERFSPRNLVTMSAQPLLVEPTHYTGEPGYFTDTEASDVINTDVKQKGDLGDLPQQQKDEL